MKVCLVSAPTITEFEDLTALRGERNQRFPMGVLCLASTLERLGFHPDVSDLDTLYAAEIARGRQRGAFARNAAEHLARKSADVYGFSTICGSYPLTIRIATALKEARPDCRIVFGGPQATAAAEETLEAFPAVDVIARGEGEPVLPALLEAFATSRDPASIPGLTYRSGDGIAKTEDAPLVMDLDSLPLPAFHLYPGMKRPWSLPLEVGRGCPFSCTFCSTNRFFGRRFRMKSPARIVEDMLTLRRSHGTRRFELIHDNFTVERRRVVEFCESVSSARAGLTWSCSTRTDTIDDELIDLMWRAGCRSLFFGVESGSPSMQRAIGKRLDLSGARGRFRRTNRRRMTAVLSFITGFPEEKREDLRDTVSFFVDSLRFDYLEPQIGLLSPLTGTPVHERHKHELIRDEIVSDMAFQGEEQEPVDQELIGRHPEIFSSYYSVPTRWLDRRELCELRGFLLNGRFELRWLLLAAAQLLGGGLSAFEAFRGWRFGADFTSSSPAPTGYYEGPAFRRDFVRFVRQEVAGRLPASKRALRGLARYYAIVLRSGKGHGRDQRNSSAPRLAPNVQLARLGCDVAAIVRTLRNGGDLSSVPTRPSSLVTRFRRGRHEMIKVREEVADLLELCDGSRDPRSVASAFRERYPNVGGIPGDAVALFGLETLRRRGLLARSGRRTRRTASP